MDNLPPIGSLGPPQNTNLPWVQWAEIAVANDNARNRNTAWKIYLVYLREGSSWEAGSHQEIRHYFLVARAYRQARSAWSSPSPTQLWRSANLCEENWAVALGHFLVAQYPTHERLLFWASNRRVYPAVHGGVLRPRTDETINRTSGPGPRTADGTNNLVSLSVSLGVESYYSGIPSMVAQFEVSENASQPLALMDDGTEGGSQESESGSLSDGISPEGNSANTTAPEPSPEPSPELELEPEAELEAELDDDEQRPLVATPHPGQHGISSRNGCPSTSYYTAYSPASVLNNALRGLEPEFEEYDSKAGNSPRLPTPALPHHKPQPVDVDGELTRHPDAHSRQTISELIHAVKGDVDKLSHEIFVHRRAAANRRADIRGDVAELRGNFNNFRTNTLNTLEGITKRVALVEQLAAGLCQNQNAGSMNSLNEGNTGDTSPILSHVEMYTMISGIKEKTTTLLAVDKAPDPRVAQIQRSLNTTQGYFEQCLQEMEKDIWDLKRKHEADTLTIDDLKRQITTQLQINATMMEALHSMEKRVGQQLRALNARLEMRQGE